MLKKVRELNTNSQVLIFFLFTIGTFYCVALCTASPIEIIKGLAKIVITRDVLITDYFKISGVGAAFFNSATVMAMVLLIVKIFKLNFTGLTIATMMIMGGFALFGKNPVNTIPIIIGSILYSKMQGVSLGRYIYIGFMATGVAPIITEIVKSLPIPKWIGVIFAIIIGILIGYVAPPLSAHTVGMHMGYNIFNVGFAIGIIAMCVMSVLSFFGYKSQPVIIWTEGRPFWLIILLYGYFIITALYGLYISEFKLDNFKELLKHPGRSVADFLLLDGVGATLLNVGIVGIIGLSYILFIKGDLSGPVIGAILTVAGFGAFGIHMKNYLPILAGVFLASIIGIYSPTTPSMQLAALFSGALAPIAGQYGILAGLIAGFLHAAIVCTTGVVYNGMNLYNNGFAAGFVAILMVPMIESFMKRYKKDRR